MHASVWFTSSPPRSVISNKPTIVFSSMHMISEKILDIISWWKDKIFLSFMLFTRLHICFWMLLSLMYSCHFHIYLAVSIFHLHIECWIMIDCQVNVDTEVLLVMILNSCYAAELSLTRGSPRRLAEMLWER